MKKLLQVLFFMVLMVGNTYSQNPSNSSHPSLNDFVWESEFKSFESSQDETSIFTSEVINLEFKDRPEHFITFSSKWKSNEHDGWSISFRSSVEGKWTAWSTLEHDHHLISDEGYEISQLLFIDKATEAFQYRITGNKNLELDYLEFRLFAPSLSPVSDDSSTDYAALSQNSSCNCSQPTYKTRLQWNCPDGNSQQSNCSPSYTNVSHLIVHHTAGVDNPPYDAVIQGYWYQHVIQQGWCDLGYNYMIAPDGTLYQGRAGGNNVIGAHMCANNSNTFGVCLMGNFQNTNPTQAALDKLVELLAWKSCDSNINPLGNSYHSSSGFNMDHISGHQDGCSTLCPGTNLYPLMSSIASDIDSYINNGCSLSSNNSNCAPSNDECSNAISLNVNTSCNYQSFDVGCATQSYPDASCDGYNSALVEDVFFSFVAPSSGEVTVIVDPSSGYDPRLFVMQNCGSSYIACSDDGGGEGYSEDLTVSNLNPGQTYYIRVYDYTQGGYQPNTTNINICVYGQNVTPPPPPPSGCNASQIMDVQFVEYESDGDVDVDAISTIGSDVDYYTFNWYVNGVLYDSDNSSDNEDGKHLPCGVPLGVSVTVYCNNGQQSTESAIYPFSFPCQPTDPCENSTLQVTSSITDDICSQSQGQIELTITGGTAPYSFNWNDGYTLEDRNNITAGTYSYTVTDSDGCTINSSAQVDNQNSTFNITASVNDATCGQANGTIDIVDITAIQGNFSGSATYAWNNGAGNTSTLTSLTQGTYTVTVTDAITTCQSIESFIINDTGINPILNIQSQDATCGQDNGSFTAFIVNDNGGQYNFNITGTNTNINPTSPSSIEVQNLTAGTYSLNVSDANGCNQQEMIAIGDSQNNPVAVLSPNHIYCSAGNSNSGTVNAVVSGGEAPFSYNWSNGQTGITISNIDASDYTATITDANGCSTTATTTLLDLSMNLTWETVNPSSPCAADGKIAISPYGGIPPYSITWTDNQEEGALIRCNLSDGILNAVVVDATGCMMQASFNLEPYEPEFNVTVNSESCYGTADGGITVVSDSLFQHQIVQITLTGTDTIFQSIGNEITGLPADTYWLTIMDEDGCEYDWINPIIIEQTSPLLAQASSDPNDCGASVLAAGGTAPYTYLWLENSDTDSYSTNYQSGEMATVEVIDLNGCSTIDSVEVMYGIPNPSFSTDANGMIVNFIPDDLNGNHEWEFPSGWINVSTSPTESFKDTGDYIIIHHISNECGTASDTMMITVTESTTGTNDLDLMNELQLYPNPNNGAFLVSFGIGGSYDLEVIDVLSRVVVEKINIQVSNGESYPFDLSFLSSGSYFVRVADLENDRSTVLKMIVR